MHEAFSLTQLAPSLDFNSAVDERWLGQVALEADGLALTYRELKDQVHARGLALGTQLGKGEFVALEVGRSASFVINLLAGLSIGAVVAPIDPALPEQRRKWLLDTLHPRVHVLPDHDQWQQGRGALPSIREGDAPAYVFFTSGSTGTPKAIVGSVEGLRQFVRWQGEQFGVGPGDRVSFLTALGFDVALRDILLPLFHGATLVIPAQDDVVTPQAAVQWLIRQNITRVHTVPSIARLWGRVPEGKALRLRTLFLAGEKLTESTLDSLLGSFPDIEQWVNLYGPTETTLARFYQSIATANTTPAKTSGVIAVGAALPNTEFHLIRDDRQDLPWHVPETGVTQGEVVIVAQHTSLGYLDAPDLTSERFHQLADGRTAYRTGDIGALTDSGALVILGRKDDEVKVNGVRVHPLEVETVVAGAAGVREVAVIAETLSSGDVRLLAFWVAEPDASERDDAAPRHHASANLPQAFVPTLWRRLDALPLNANGKLDRQVLLASVRRSAQPGEQEHDGETRWLLDTVADLLSVEQVHLQDDFFALGGSSLQVAFLLGQIDQQLNKRVDFAPVFEQSSLAAIAGLLREAPVSRQVAIKPVPAAPAYHLSPQQRRWWNIYLPQGNRSWATMVRVIGLAGQYAPTQVEQALARIVDAQVSMQLYFSQEQGELRQHVQQDRGPLSVVVHDLSNDDDHPLAPRLETLRLQIANQEIDPFVWPLFRIHHVKLPGNASQLIFAIHHMISDGYSVGLIEAALRTQLEQSQPYEANLPFNYLDYAQWAREDEPLSFGPGSAASDYWQAVMDPPYQKVVFPEQWRGNDEDRGRSFCIEVPSALRQVVIDTARREHLTEFSLYLAGKFLAWHESLDRDDLVIGTPAAGRELSGTQSILGNFISLVCVRSRLSAGQNQIEYAREIMHAVARAMTYQGYQYDTLVQTLDLPLEQARFPLTTLFISYLNFEALRSRPLASAELGHTDLGFAVKFDMMAYVREHQGATSLQLQYRNNLFQTGEVEAFTQRWIAALGRLTA